MMQKNNRKREGLRQIGTFLMSLLLACSMMLSAVPAGDVQAADTTVGTVTLGSAGTVLEKGETYTVPLSLMHADANRASAAAACPGKYGTLEIGEDGTATLTVSLRSVTVGTITDWAYDFKVYQEDSYTSSTEGVTVEEKTQVAWNYSGNEKKQAPYADGMKTVPTKIRFTIPKAMLSKDYVYITMYVDAMGDDPDARLFIDYENAVKPGSEKLNYTKKATGHIDQFGEYDVEVAVTVEEGIITEVTATGSNFGGTYASQNEKTYLPMASEHMTECLKNLYDTDEDLMNDVDVVSGATTTAKTIKKTAMKALGYTMKEEVIPDAPTSVPAAGVYTIQMKDITDVVAHSLIGKTGSNEWNTGYLTVDASGNMSLSFRQVNCTSEEPLHILGFNGYYSGRANNGTGGTLITDTTKFQYKTGTCATHGTTVVTDVHIPLVGSSAAPQQYYYTNTYLYVEAMKNLNGESGGVNFENGKFNIDTTITLNWNTLKKTDADPYFPAQEEKTEAAVTVGQTVTSGGASYTVTAVSGEGSDLTAEVSYDGIVEKKAAKKVKKVTVADTVTVNGVACQVTSIADNALKGCKKLKTVVIGKNVKTIGKKAFYGCKNIKKVIVKSQKLTKVGAKAFAKMNKKATIKVPKKQYKKYKKLLKGKGVKVSRIKK